MELKSTKSYNKLPCSHAQYFDKEPDGSVGECAAVHGYSRTIKFTFAGKPDENGWIVPFGELRDLKKFIEYYFDHTSLFPADDPRLQEIKRIDGDKNIQPNLFNLRVLPYGVSMESSSRFIWELVNPHIVNITGGRCYVEKVESIEHEANSAYVESTREFALDQAESFALDFKTELEMKPIWKYKNPQF